MARSKAEKKSARKKKRQFKPQTQNINDAAAEKKPRSRRLRNAVGIVAFCLILLSAAFLAVNWPFAPQQPAQPQTQTENSVPAAAIIDGLYDKRPNPELTQSMVQYLSSAGYHVDVFQGANVTIDLLRNIGGYKTLILRVHSVIKSGGFLCIFSGEEYTESKYLNEQLSGAVGQGVTTVANETPVFALNAVYLGVNKPDGLNGTTIILTGCNGTATPYAIQRFFERGVKAYVSWDGYVDLSHSDEATLQLVKDLYAEGLSVDQAVKKVMTDVGPDPLYGSELLYRLP